MTFRPRSLVLPLTLAFACSPAPVPIATSSRDPSSPSAPEGVAPSPDHHHSSHGDTRQATDAGSPLYVCPMHPEVTSKVPGTCPKCNMKLVPKE